MGRPPMPPGTWGTVWTSNDGAPYKARARFRDWDGKTRTVARFGQTKTAARHALLAALRDYQSAGSESAITRDSTVARLAAAWLARGCDDAGRPWAANTCETYRYIVANQVEPALGAMRIGELRLAVVNRALASVAAHTGPGAAKTMKTVLSGMCRLAIAHEALDGNPVRDAMRIPRPRKAAVRALTPDEADDLCDRLRADEQAVLLDLPDLVEWMLGTGARIGESCAARAASLDLDAGTWEINATLIRLQGVRRLRELERNQARTAAEEEELEALRTLGPGLHIQERPKTAAGWRVLALPPFAVQMVQRRRSELRLRGPQGVVFGAPQARALRDPSNTAGDLRAALDRLGYPWVHSHTFRKTVATRLDEGGLTAREIADQLGHAKPSMTQDVYMGRAVVSATAARILDR